MGINAILHTFRNLANLRLSPGRVRPVFAGEAAQFTICIDNPGAARRYSIGLTRDKKEASFTDVPAQQTTLLGTAVPTVRRGLLRPGRLTLFTTFPLGLYYAWAYFEPAMQCVVYPRPAPPGLALPPASSSDGQGIESGQGQEDFSGLRQYHPGDSPRHIAWKAAARGQGLLTKQFSGRVDSELWLSWYLLPPRMNLEDKMSHLARWVLDAHAAGMSYGLKLPGKTVAIAGGNVQCERSLEALALFDNGREPA